MGSAPHVQTRESLAEPEALRLGRQVEEELEAAFRRLPPPKAEGDVDILFPASFFGLINDGK